jgi:general secretion pathway protein D
MGVGDPMVGNINRMQLKAAVFILILAGVVLAKAQPIPGATFTPSGVKPWLQDAMSQLAQLPDGTKSVKIASERLTLSYIDPLRATQLLALHGYTIGQPDTPVNSTNLPVVVALSGTINVDTIPTVTEKFPQTETDPVNELVVFHDENDQSQLSGIMAIIKNDIDLPARQMIIEAMILEVSSTALKELGVKWTRASGAKESGNFINSKLSNLVVGSVRNPATDVALDLSTKGVFHDLNTQIKALVREGEAEILSRPSVLALDNRMAYISVAEDIPIARSSYAKNDYQSTSFAKEKAGITLALRPRIDAKGQEVSMQVNAEVTAKVPDGDLEVRNKDGMILASAPTISRREVKTYVRVANNTPFIIGGLIAKDKLSTVDKVPLLGDIPLLGGVFRSKKNQAVKREVIIVLTPFVLPEEHVIGKNMPKDEDAFDSVGNQLFRDAYRIRAEDTFDLNYLYENKQLQRMKALANRIIATDVKLASEYPYSQFVDKAVPGEAILCYRQIYEVLKRRGMQDKLNSTKLIFFESDRNIGSGHQVQFLEEYIRNNAPEILTEKGGSKAVLLTFDMKRDSDDAKSIFNEPVPQVKLVDCADRKDWSKQLWEFNQHKEDGEEQFAVLLREKKDMERLKYAVLMKKTVELNTEELVLTLSSFTRGRLLLMPRVKEQDVELIDGDVARAFFYSEMYYQALQKEMEKDLTAFRKVIEEKDHLKKLVNPSPRP